MSPEAKPDLELQLAHVLFVDVVGYSRLLIDEQRELLDELNTIVRAAPEFRRAETEGNLVRLPAGDGMALVFFTTPDVAVRCALQIAEALRGHQSLRVRMGINSGPVSATKDVNDRSNIAGPGINFAKRVMDCGDAGHILLSKRTADDLSAYRQWQPYLRQLGECTVKHGEVISVVNLCTERAGNAALPEKMRAALATEGARSSRRKKAVFGVALLVAVILGAIAFYFVRRETAPPAGKSIAVLPFQNLSDDPANAYFAGGIQEDVLTNLAKISGLKVISRTSVMKYQGTTETAREIGRALNVATVLEGSVRRAGNQVRVTVQLIETETDKHLWAENYDREVTDVLALQSELALQIASTLRAQLSPQEKVELQRAPTRNPDAYLVYLEAHDAIQRSQSSADLAQAAALYERATKIDPSFALAYARLSYCYGTLYQGSSDPGLLAKARQAAEESLRIAPDLPEGHLARGYLYYRGERDYDRALAELEIARAGLPNTADIYLVTGSIKRRQGKWSESTADLERAAELNPKDAFLWTNIAMNYQALREYTAAERAFDRGVAADPSHFMNRALRAWLFVEWKADLTPLAQLLETSTPPSDPDGTATLALYRLQMLRRDFDGARRRIEASNLEEFSAWRAGGPYPKAFLLAQAHRFLNDPERALDCYREAKNRITGSVEKTNNAAQHALLGQICAGLGQRDEAIQHGKRATELLPETTDALDGPAMTLALAQIYAALGEADNAVPLVKHSLASNAGITVALLRIDPVWDPLRNDPGFQRLLEVPPP